MTHRSDIDRNGCLKVDKEAMDDDLMYTYI